MKYYVFYPDKSDIGAKLEAPDLRTAAEEFFAQHPRSDDRGISVVPSGWFSTVAQFRTSEFMDDQTRHSIPQTPSLQACAIERRQTCSGPRTLAMPFSYFLCATATVMAVLFCSMTAVAALIAANDVFSNAFKIFAILAPIAFTLPPFGFALGLLALCRPYRRRWVGSMLSVHFITLIVSFYYMTLILK